MSTRTGVVREEHVGALVSDLTSDMSQLVRDELQLAKAELKDKGKEAGVGIGLFGGDKRSDIKRRVTLEHGDVVVWGGPARLAHHGVLPLKDGTHPATGRCRINLTFRKAA